MCSFQHKLNFWWKKFNQPSESSKISLVLFFLLLTACSSWSSACLVPEKSQIDGRLLTNNELRFYGDSKDHSLTLKHLCDLGSSYIFGEERFEPGTAVWVAGTLPLFQPPLVILVANAMKLLQVCIYKSVITGLFFNCLIAKILSNSLGFCSKAKVFCIKSENKR